MAEASRVEAVFCMALEKQTAEERAAYLAEACQDAPELRHAVERLLAAHASAGDFVEQPPSGLGPTIDVPGDERGDFGRDVAIDLAGTWVGPYKLMEMIGEGGMGVVYMAEQKRPIRRRVALKVIKPGLDTRQVIARFEAERQALAMMDNANIARVFDAGTTESGRPYFVMELVRGVPITDYCDLNNLPLHERLELFGQVCHAVQHAHQKGIIHRDLKPSNVLVTLNDGRAVPKVIDFGVAKAINQQLTDKTLFTNFAQMVGTPLYMSPEQAEMSSLDVDTRTDVYSLGVLLYELLTGTTPFDRQRLGEAGYDEIRRIIREEEPLRPSTRITTLGQARTTVAAHRAVEPNRFSQLLRGDLDWIVMKSLEKDRTRRYESASAMAADVQRYLSHEPVEAGPPSAWYRYRKFIRRNRIAMAAVATVFGVLLLATGVSSWLAVRAMQAEERADVHAGKAHANAVAALSEKDRADIKAREAETNAIAASNEKERADSKAAEAEASARQAVEAQAKAVEEAKRARLEMDKAQQVASFLAHMFEESSPVQIGGMRFGIDKSSSNTAAAARQILDRGALRVSDELRDQPLVQAALKDTMGNAYWALGAIEQATVLWEEAFELRRKQLPREHAEMATSLHSLALLRFGQYRFAEAAALAEEAFAIRRKLLGNDDPLVDDSRLALATVLGVAHPHGFAKDFPRAVTLCRESVEWHRKHYGFKHRQTALAMLGLAGTLLNGQPAGTNVQEKATELQEAMKLVAQATPILLKDPATKAMGQTISRFQGAVLSLNTGDTKLGFSQLEAALKSLREAAPAEHPFSLTIMRMSGFMYAQRSRWNEAEALLREIVSVERRLKLDTTFSALEMALIAQRVAREDSGHAESLYRDSVQLMNELLSGGPVSDAETNRRIGALATLVHAFGEFLQSNGEADRAAALYQDFVRTARQCPEKVFAVTIVRKLGNLAQEAAKLAEAQRCYSDGLELIQSAPEMASSLRQLETTWLMLASGKAFEAAGDMEQAERRYRNAILMGSQEAPSSADAKDRLSSIATVQDEDARLAAQEIQQHQVFFQDFSDLPWVLGDSLRDNLQIQASLQSMRALAKLLEKQGRPPEAATLPRLRSQADISRALQFQSSLAKVKFAQGRNQEAEELYRNGLQLAEGLDEQNQRLTLYQTNRIRDELGELLVAADRPDEALQMYRKIIVADPAGSGVVAALRHALIVLLKQDHAGALAQFVKSLLPVDRVEGSYTTWSGTWKKFYDTAKNVTPDATVRDALIEAAVSVLAEARAQLGEKNLDISTLQIVIGETHLTNGNLVEAESLLRESLATRRDILPETHRQLGNAERLWATWLYEMKRYDEAEPILVSAYPKVVGGYGSKDVKTIGTLQTLVRLYEATNRLDQAEVYRKLLADDNGPEPKTQ